MADRTGNSGHSLPLAVSSSVGFSCPLSLFSCVKMQPASKFLLFHLKSTNKSPGCRYLMMSLLNKQNRGGNCLPKALARTDTHS